MVSSHPYNNKTATGISNWQDPSEPTPPTLSCSYDTLYYSNDGYSVRGDYTFRSNFETTKEQLIRQRSAFKLFYPAKINYTVTKTKKDFSAEHTETIKRESKFKNINLNLII